MLLIFACSNCKKSGASGSQILFDSIPVARPVIPMINEVSGIADSKTAPGFLWAHEDSGNPTQLYLIKHDGSVVKSIFLKGTTNRDWEDMALLDGSIYIGDIGDNNQVQTEYSFYKFPEPASSTDTVQNVERIRFQYPDGAHDAEGFLADPVTKNIYIISKRDNPSKVYKLSYPFASNNTVAPVRTLPYTGVVSAAISLDGKEILIKTYSTIYYYYRLQGESIEQALQKEPKVIKYQPEPQGEAVCFANNGTGYFTLSEKGFASWVNLNFYKRK